MEELLKGSNVENLNEGSIIKGTIIEIRPTEVVVDIGGKSEGIVLCIFHVFPNFFWRQFPGGKKTYRLEKLAFGLRLRIPKLSKNDPQMIPN